jgi:hypothetical protein
MGIRRTLGRLRSLGRARLEVRRWERRGRPVPPPPLVKRRTLRCYARRHGLRTFVETGTFYGDTAAAIRSQVDTVITIEISPQLAADARRRFERDRQVRVLEGDSGRLLPEVLNDLSHATLFWLDGHYSGGVTGRGDTDTPVRAELAAIFRHAVRGHVILIDDARHFDGRAYPSLDEIAELARSADYRFEVRDDIIRLTPTHFA